MTKASHQRQRLLSHCFWINPKSAAKNSTQGLFLNEIKVNRITTCRNHKSAFQALILNFVMQAKDVQNKTKQQPFGSDFCITAKQKSSEIKIVLYICKAVFGLNGTIYSQQTTLFNSAF